MSIATELQNYADGLDDSYDAVDDMGGIIPQHKNMNNLDQAIRTIPQGPSYTAGSGIDITGSTISVDNTAVPFFSDLASVATSGNYSDLNGTPSLAAVATSGDYTDLINTPTIPTVNDATLTITQNGTSAGTFTANASSNTTIALTDTTYSDFTGASSGTAGAHGLVPAPSAGDESKVLSGAGTWVAQTAAQVNSDWDAASGVAQILNKPSLATVATTGDYDDLLNKPSIVTPLDIYPVGAIYMSVNNTNPGTLFGGTWEQIQDRFILAAGSTYTGGTTGGAATINLAHSHTVNSHNHSLPANTGSHTLTVNEMPSHKHSIVVPPRYGWEWGDGGAMYGQKNSTSANNTQYTDNTGGGQGHTHPIGGNTGDKSPGTNSQLSSTQSILPPYLAVYVWKRTA